MNILPDPNNTLVYDIGASHAKFGFAGDAQPIFCIPTSYVTREMGDTQEVLFGDKWLNINLPNLEVKQIIQDNGFLSSDSQSVLPKFFQATYSSEFLRVDPTEHPVLINQPSHLLYSQMKNKEQFRRWRKEMCSTLFENSGHPMVCIEHDSSLAALSRNVFKAGIVIDFGWSSTRVVPILDGKPYEAAMRLNPFGACHVAKFLQNILAHQNLDVYSLLDPPSVVTKNGIPIPQMQMGPTQRFPATDSQRKYQKREIIIDILKTHLNFSMQNQKIKDPSEYQYSMPGRQPIQTSFMINQARTIFWTQQQDVKALPELIQESIHNCPGDVRRLMWKNVIPCGGFSSIPCVYERLEQELRKYVPKNYSVEIKKPFTNPSISGGKFSVWCGGSILGSFDGFSEFCITKKEWEESGESIFENKCK